MPVLFKGIIDSQVIVDFEPVRKVLFTKIKDGGYPRRVCVLSVNAGFVQFYLKNVL